MTCQTQITASQVWRAPKWPTFDDTLCQGASFVLLDMVYSGSCVTYNRWGREPYHNSCHIPHCTPNAFDCFYQIVASCWIYCPSAGILNVLVHHNWNPHICILVVSISYSKYFIKSHFIRTILKSISVSCLVFLTVVIQNRAPTTSVITSIHAYLCNCYYWL